MRSITKHFGGVHALTDVSFRAEGGEVHALVGENGAGKSTLMKILSGAYTPDKGEIYLDGEKLELSNTQAARDRGIAVIYQEFSLAKHLTVAENIYLDDLGFGSSVINWRKLKKSAEQQIRSLGLTELDAYTLVSELSVAQQQIVEICKALRRKAKVIVFDEPTAVLTDRETARLFELIARLKQDGVCIIYISHRLAEVFEICDCATVMKDGRLVDTVDLQEVSQGQLVQLMVGRELKDLFPKRHAAIGEVVLDVKNLNAGDRVHDVSFQVKAGEVLGFCGLVGAGRTEIMRAIFGADKRDSGAILLRGKQVDNRSPVQAVRTGIGMLPEDRKQQGVLLDLSVRVNAMMKPKNPFQRFGGWLDQRREIDQTNQVIRTLRIKVEDSEVAASSLSGGNQQKVAVAKWVFSDCNVLICDEPTRGVDIGAKIEIYQIINQLAERGVAVVVVSSELPELVGLCDRVVVVRDGRLVGDVSGQDINEQTLIGLAVGVRV
jgi:ribose transport system ATP-binding protein